MTDLASRSQVEQVAILQDVAREAAGSFGLDVQGIEPVLVAYNATFRVDDPSDAWALRVLVGSHSDERHIAAQQSWQLDLAAETDVRVPTPRRTVDGAWQTRVAHADAGRALLATAAGWLDGEDVAALDADVARVLGATMARMHDHAATWRIPTGAEIPAYREALFGDAPILLDAAGLDARARDVLTRSLEIADAAQERVHGADEPRIIHADLHAGNLKRSGASLQIFDFDDAALGAPALDLAIAAFYADEVEIRAALEAGYRSVRALPQVDPVDAEAMLAGRQLLLANDMLGSETATVRAQADAYLPRAVARLEAWLETGRFSRSAA